MKQALLISSICLAVAGCSEFDINNYLPAPPHLQTQPGQSGADLPPADATTASEFDTASEQDRMAAITSAPTTSGSLGTTVANLGDPTIPGFWLETPLVSSEMSGRIQSKATGRTVKVQLRPTTTGGSRMSLSALQLLDLDLTGLHEIVVYGP